MGQVPSRLRRICADYLLVLKVVNTARGALCVAEDVAEALKSGQINGYGGDGNANIFYLQES